jgi:hypothetical protein
MRINSRNWPLWLLGAATLWYVAIVAFWAFRPLDDHVPTTVPHVPTAQEVATAQADGTTPPTRAAGPTVAVECGSPASSSARNLDDERTTLAGLVDTNGTPLVGAQFERVPCVSAHSQAHLLWYGNTVLYLLAVGGTAAVLIRRRRHHRHLPDSAFAAA